MTGASSSSNPSSGVQSRRSTSAGNRRRRRDSATSVSVISSGNPSKTTTLLVPLLGAHSNSDTVPSTSTNLPSCSTSGSLRTQGSGVSVGPAGAHTSILLPDHQIPSTSASAGLVGVKTAASQGTTPLNREAVLAKPLSTAWQTALSSATAMSANKRRVQRRGKVIPDRPPRALFCLSLTNPVRKLCIDVVEWKSSRISLYCSFWFICFPGSQFAHFEDKNRVLSQNIRLSQTTHPLLKDLL